MEPFNTYAAENPPGPVWTQCKHGSGGIREVLLLGVALFIIVYVFYLSTQTGLYSQNNSPRPDKKIRLNSGTVPAVLGIRLSGLHIYELMSVFICWCDFIYICIHICYPIH